MRRFLGPSSTVTLIVVLVAGMFQGPVAAKASRSTISVIHGLPEFTADVYLNGELLLDGFEPTQTIEPMATPPGRYDIAIRELGAPADSEPVLQDTLRLGAGEHISVVAHLDAAGNATLSWFSDRFAPVDAGRARLVVRAVADAPQLRVTVDGSRVKRSLAPGQTGSWVYPAAAHTLRIEGQGETLARSDISLKEGTASVVYVIGSAEEGNVQLMTERLGDVHTAPNGVLTGTGGLAAQRGFSILAALSMLLVAALFARRVAASGR